MVRMIGRDGWMNANFGYDTPYVLHQYITIVFISDEFYPWERTVVNYIVTWEYVVCMAVIWT